MNRQWSVGFPDHPPRQSVNRNDTLTRWEFVTWNSAKSWNSAGLGQITTVDTTTARRRRRRGGGKRKEEVEEVEVEIEVDGMEESTRLVKKHWSGLRKKLTRQ